MPIQEVNSNRTREQHSADSRRAGIASGEARRRKRDLKQAIEIMLSLDVKTDDDFDKIGDALVKYIIKK